MRYRQDLVGWGRGGRELEMNLGMRDISEVWDESDTQNKNSMVERR